MAAFDPFLPLAWRQLPTIADIRFVRMLMISYVHTQRQGCQWRVGGSWRCPWRPVRQASQA